MKRLLLLLVTLLFAPALIPAQVLINEVSSASTTFTDEDGDQEDWIEFYNPGSTSINMQGYTITCTEGQKNHTWTFPSVFIKPNGFLTIFCSKKNRSTWFDHWEVPVYANNPWKYFVGSSEPPSTWRDITFNDGSWSTGIGGIGYGDGDDSTLVAPTVSLYMRKSFFVADTSKIPTAAFLLDFDDGFVAYLNNVEIARANVGVYGDHPPYTTFAYNEHEAQMYQTGNFSAGYFIDPHVVDSALKPGMNVLSIQTHNFSSGLDDMSMIPYFLIGVNDTSVTYFPLAANIHLHTNFTLNSAGQTLTLKDAGGNVLDQENIGTMLMNNTRGRRPDGTNNWCLFDNPTPDSTNNTSACYSGGYTGQPTFTLPAGFYTGTQTIGFNAAPNEIVHYTTDGSVPTFSSPVFSGPITITSTKVIRARTFPTNSNYLPGLDVVNTYFINENVSVPVISLSTDSVNLFDYNYGIYVFGPNADLANVPYFGANFWQGWSRPAHVEFFDASGNQGFETHSEIKIQGNYSKAWPQRGFSVKAKDDYGGIVDIPYRIFPDKPISKYRSFNIRNAGSDWNTCHMRDRLNQKTVQKMMNLDIMDGRPAVLFINGKYWGLYELREKQDKDYIAENHNVDADSLDFLEFDGSVIEGSNKGFLDMVNYIGNNNMSLQSNYDSVTQMIDIKNFADYFITETYICNIDWLGTYTNNIKYWRTNNPVGKWRYMLWDTDLSLGFLPWYDGNDTTNMLGRAINPTVSNPHSIMLKSLLNNTGFRNYFVDRYCDAMNTIFRPYKFIAKSEDLHDEMLPEMSRQFLRWGNQSPMPGMIGRSNDVPSWEYEIDSMQLFMNNRPNNARTYIKNQFNLVKPVTIALAVDPPGAGTIRISTIVPDSLPWTGIYFDGVPVTMTVNANAGYKFLYWKCNSSFSGENDSVSITRDVHNDDTFTAYFRSLELNFSVSPNPFGSSVTFSYELPEDAQASLRIYNVLGQKVAEVISSDEFTKAGSYSITLNPDQYTMDSGVYFAEFKAGDYSKVIKIVRARE